MSYAMARLKAEALNRYQNNDNRYFIPSAWLRNAMVFEKGYAYQWPEKSEAELRALIAKGGTNRKLVTKGGAWWRHTEMHKAQARGDQETLRRLQAEQDALLGEIVSSSPTGKRR
jgi:hypothetical protein